MPTPRSVRLVTLLLLGGCADQLPGSQGAEQHALQIEPANVLESSDAAPAREEVSPTPCEISDLHATYRDDDSPARGELTVSWLSTVNTAAAIAVEIEGAAPEADVVPAGETRFVAGTRIQDSDETDGDVTVAVHVELACGASLERVFVFKDPVKACAVATLDGISGDEAIFYECAERWLAHGEGCGTDGYLLGYGAVYANKFYNETRPKMSEAGKAWIDHTLVCLQEQLRSSIALGTSCADVKTLAFASHPDCYAESGVCTLPICDIVHIPETIDERDLLSRDGVLQLVGIVPQCGEEYAEAIVGTNSAPQIASNP